MTLLGLKFMTKLDGLLDNNKAIYCVISSDKDKGIYFCQCK